MGKKNKNKNEGQAGSGTSGAQPSGQAQQTQGRQQQSQGQQQQRPQRQEPSQSQGQQQQPQRPQKQEQQQAKGQSQGQKSGKKEKKQEHPQSQQQQQSGKKQEHPQGQQQQQQSRPKDRQQEPPQHTGKKQQQPEQSEWRQQQQPQGQSQAQQSGKKQQGKPQQQSGGKQQGQQQQPRREQPQQSGWSQQQQQSQPPRGRQQAQQQGPQPVEGTSQCAWTRGRGQAAPGQQQGTWGPGASAPGQQQGNWGPGASAPGQQGTWGPGASAPGQQQGTWGPGASAPGQQQGTWGPGASAPGQQQGTWGPGAPAPGQQQGTWGPGASAPGQQQGTWGPGASAPGQQQGTWGPGASAPGQQQGAWGPGASAPGQQQGTWGPGASAPGQQQGTWGPGALAPGQQQGTWGPGASAPQQSPWGAGPSAPQQGALGPSPSAQQQQIQQQSLRGSSGAQSRELSSSSSGSVPRQAGRPTSVQKTAHDKSETPSPRQTSVSKSSSTTSFSSNVSQRSIPPGTQGIRGECEANYLVLNLDKMPNVAYHYDVTITPDRPKKFFRKAFRQFVNTYLGGCSVAFDGVKSCYLVQRLPHPVYEGDVKIPDTGSREIQFKVSIKPTDNPEIELRSLKTYHNERVFDKPMRALQCIEVVLANACHDKGIRVGRSFFTPPQRTLDLDEGYELYTGLYQAAILGDEPYLNVDISHKSFPMAYNLTDYLQKILGARLDSNLDQRTLQNISKHLRGLNIKYTPPPSFGSMPRSYKVNEVSREPASDLSFTDDKGQRLTVQRYFASKGYNLRYPRLSCIVAGSSVKPNYLPIELCSIEGGQALKRKDGTKQVQKMIRFAATSTDERKRKIMEKLQYFMHNADELVRGFGINIGNGFITVPTRLLKPPSIEYRGNRCVEPRNGSWRNIEFLTTGPTKAKEGHKWAIIYTPSKFLRHGNLQDLSNMLFNQAKRMGINLSAQREIKETRDIVKTLEEYKRNSYDLVIVVIPGFGTTYADIKQKAELVCGLLTQCIKEQTVNRGVNDQLVGNLLLKVNSKLNGANHKIAERANIKLDNVMFMGADVTHPSPDQRDIPSVVGVAASHDLNGASYNMQYRLQESTKEEIVDMQSICRHHLKVYFQRQNCYPKSIIYYRDGVSDGQFQKVEILELGAIRAVCKELRISPKITCVIVVKRHHTRFFPTKPTGDKFNNVLPGTVVDQKIVHPNETQFFMVSHQSIQGTAKPTRYNVIVDDAKMNMDDLQKLTNNLCYMFPRCNRAVSYPAPAYLAHLVAARGRVYIEGPPLRRGLREEYNKRIINEQFMNTTPMFFV
ncbi:protein argonaute-2 isoform X2 [Eurosta solidaginis]|uniref:protein argonaute-2 isoform X2 n=1 Tax=Eurosta solidaginis TaxID=178769 RepID=UPI00353130E9